MNSREYLKELVRESVMEALSESVNDVDAINESVERDIIVTEGAKLTPQGRRVLDDIEQILVENTEHLTAGQSLHRFLFGGSNAISQDRVNKIVSGVDKIFDVCHRTDLFTKTTRKNDKISYLAYLAVKGKFVYQFQLKFSVGSNKVVSASFTEKQIEAANFVIPVDAIKMAIKGCSSDYILEITNTTIKSGAIGRGFYQPNIINDKLLRAIANKYEGKCRFDENAGGVVFYNMERLTYSGTGSNGKLI